MPTRRSAARGAESVELTEVLRRRQMVRAYDPDRPVPPATMTAVVDAALRAPSAGFSQGTSLLVLADAEARHRFWAVTAPDGGGSWLAGMQTAPALILVWVSRETYLDRYAAPDKGRSSRDPAEWVAPYWFVDAGMASMAALLAAVDAGLGACFFGLPVDRVDAVRTASGVPADQLTVGVISLGYPDPTVPATGSARTRRRRPRDELVHVGAWGS